MRVRLGTPASADERADSPRPSPWVRSNATYPAAVVAAVVVGVVGWFVLCAFVRWSVVPRLAASCGGDALSGFLRLFVDPYARVLHRAEFVGQDELRAQQSPGPLIVVANHSAGVDPILVQCGMRGHVRWMMDREMMLPALEWVWTHQRVIPVDVEGGDARAALVAIRHLRENGVLGVFPEGRIARPPETLLPFMPGVGLLVAKSGAPVLLCWISGTPRRERAFQSLFARSRSRVHYLELIRYPPRSKPSSITEDLRQRLADASGWPMVDQPASPTSAASLASGGT